jgi:alkylation response protein AidB-like acyl-CoA dehydrogenase
MTSKPDWIETRLRVKQFVEERIYPVEHEMDHGNRTEQNLIMAQLMDEAKEAGLWALGHPVEIGGQGMPFLDYVHVNEVIGRSYYAMQALGTLSLQDSLMLSKYASSSWREQYLKPLVAGESVPIRHSCKPLLCSRTVTGSSRGANGSHPAPAMPITRR